MAQACSQSVSALVTWDGLALSVPNRVASATM